MEREAKDREAEANRERKRIAGGQWPGMPGTSGYLGMGPAYVEGSLLTVCLFS